MAKKSMYEELMNKHNIVSIMGGSDLAIDPVTGDLKMGKRGDLMWQGKAHNSMFQFVRDYEMKAPRLKAQFAEILESHIKEAGLVDALNKHAEETAKSWMQNQPHHSDGEEMHALSDSRGATCVGREVCAASIFVTFNTMLQALKDELEVDNQKFLQSGPLYTAQSFGNVVWAASNNARHADEWRVEWVANGAFNNQQLKSIRVLAPVLGYEEKDYKHLAGEICARILEIVSGGDFDILERGLFTFANNLAAGVENNK
jgi:hypothetical protein